MCVDGLAVYPQWRPSTFYQLSQITFIVCSFMIRKTRLSIYPQQRPQIGTVYHLWQLICSIYDSIWYIFRDISLKPYYIPNRDLGQHNMSQLIYKTKGQLQTFSVHYHQSSINSASSSIWYMGSSFVPSGLQYIWCVGLKNLREWFKSYFRPGNKQTTKQWGEPSASLIIEQWPSRLFSIDIHLV